MKFSFSFLRALIPVILILTTSCITNSAQNSHGGTIPVQEYQKLMQEAKNIQLIDVRTPGEFSEGHLTNAVNIDYNGPDFEKRISTLDKSKTTFIYCLSGGRSASAMDLMQQKGFQTVYNMKGGILQWRAAGLPLAGAASATDWKGMSKEKYNELISGPVPVLVDFNARWCAPCKQLKPILEEIEKEYHGKLKIVTVDIDENKSLANALYVRNIPLLIYHVNGQPTINQEGFIEKNALIDLLHLKK
ncbi:MAG TPA: thioredoxin domain-containing protein [Chitinophagaceae bacterium]|nr:thioredoxin domain-containing protein [Chitinophagaceae bacterium]